MSVLDEEDDTTSISRAGYLISEVTAIGKLHVGGFFLVPYCSELRQIS